MGYRVRLPFHMFALEFAPGVTFLTPLSDSSNLRLGQPAQQVTNEYQKAFQKALLREGHLPILDEYLDESFRKQTLSIEVPAAKDGISYPAFSIAFDYYSQKWDKGFWGVIPVLQLEAFAKTEDKLRERLQETVKIDFARHRRLKNVKNLLEVTWYSATRHLVSSLELNVPDPGENKGPQDEDEKLLPKLAHKLQPEQPATYGREKELQQVKRILGSSFTRNVLVVGNGGVGKTALVQEVARRLDSWQLTQEIWATTAAGMIRTLMGEHSWEFNVGELVKELKGQPVILYPGNLMDLFEVGQYEGNEISIGEFLQPFLTRGELQLMAECTEQEYSAIALKNPSYLSCFQEVRLEEPAEDMLFQIIEQKTKKLAQQYGIKLERSAIHEAIRLSRRFSPYSGMPGRPIRFLESILLRKSVSTQKKLDRTEVIRAFCQESGMPPFMADPSIPMKPEAIKKAFNEQVFSQEDAVAAVVDAMATVKTALARTGKPIASFLFVGPTGVGKTELAKVLAQFMFGHRGRMVRFDMSEYSTPAAVLRLTGITQAEEGLLTGALRRQPFCVLLFDEMEKADESFNDLLLQILSEGRLTDSRGRLANFCSSIIIMTSNIGAQRTSTQPVSLRTGQEQPREEAFYHKAVQEYFRPELYNRIDRIIPFRSLDVDSVRFVVDREMQLLLRREGLKYRNVSLDIREGVLDYLGRIGHNAAYGARHLQRTIREHLILPLAEVLNQHDFEDQVQIQLNYLPEAKDTSANRIQITAHSDPLALDLLFEELGKQQNADYAGTLRRLAAGFQNGYYATVVQQEIERLEEQLKKDSTAFWADKEQVGQYTRFSELRDKGNALQKNIQELEQQLSLMVLGELAYRPDLKQELSAWEEAFFQLKLDLFSTVHAEQNRCFFQIYGESPDDVVYPYLELFHRKGFTYSLHALYYEHRHYQHYQKKAGSRKKEQTDTAPYLRKKIPYQSPDFSADDDRSTLVGIECMVFGSAVLAYLTPEAGAQSWQTTPDARENKVLIQVNPNYEPAPDTIKRPDFIRRPEIRRTVLPGFIRDTNYNWKRELHPEQLVDLLQEHLDNLFRSQIVLQVQ